MLWNRSGRELFYRAGNKLMAADLGMSAPVPRLIIASVEHA